MLQLSKFLCAKSIKRNKVGLLLILGFGAVAFLPGCQTMKPEDIDGPPTPAHLAQASYKPAVPKAEPRSKYGNPDTYEVWGKTYHVMKSAGAFKQEGTASWYGAKFHKRRTSSGEPYDMFAMTAAHKTLPLPTYVKVTNVDNEKQVIVKVNDRGPFHDDRIIDLSYAAAKQLGIYSKGTGHVSLEVISLDQAPPEKPDLFLQIGAFKSFSKALDYKAFLEGVVAQKRLAVEKKKQFYNVIMGPFKTLAKRKEAHQMLVAHGIDGVFSFMR